jgi:hypothetical protein
MPEHRENPEVRREPSDASLKWVLGVLAAVVVLAVAIHWGTWKVFGSFQRHLAGEHPPVHALSPGPEAPTPPEPRLEQVDRLAGREPNASAEPDPNRYGASDERGYVRVPVERAMDALAGKLPSRPAPPAEQTRRAGGLVDAGEPNSGRAFRKEDR